MRQTPKTPEREVNSAFVKGGSLMNNSNNDLIISDPKAALGSLSVPNQ